MSAEHSEGSSPACALQGKDERLLERRLIAPPSTASRTASTRRCRYFETYLLGPEALLAVLEIDGDDILTTTADVSKLQLLIAGHVNSA